MGAVVVLVPVIVANWSVVSAAVMAAVGALGFARANEALSDPLRTRGATREEIEVENSDILRETRGSTERIVVERDGIRAAFSRDASGRLRVCLEGIGHSRPELRRIGRELIDRVTQQHVYHRVISELRARNMAVVAEEVCADQTLRIRVRSW